MTILGLNIPEGQQLWFWSAGGDGGCLFLAKDNEEAYAKVLAMRLQGVEPTTENVNNAQRWFAENDHLEQVVTCYTGPAYTGEIQDID